MVAAVVPVCRALTAKKKNSGRQMGMFDYLRCEVPLPDGADIEQFQTKDFGCDMVEHVITADGRLLLERIDETLEVPKAERPYPNADGLMGLCGSIRTIRSKHDSNFHGVLNFYSHDKAGVWREYNAKFTDGKLIEIKAETAR